MNTALAAANYYETNHELLEQVIDELIEEMRPQLELTGSAALLFAEVRKGLASDPGRATTVAALALMRLAELTGSEMAS